jgi:hypothetical protein
MISGSLSYKKFYQHRANAKHRGIGFALSFKEWTSIWRKALGNDWLDKRHNESAVGYVMARINDEGPYALGNVKIITHSDNIVENKNRDAQRAIASRMAIARNKTDEQRAATSRWLTGRKRIDGRWINT